MSERRCNQREAYKHVGVGILEDKSHVREPRVVRMGAEVGLHWAPKGESTGNRVVHHLAFGTEAWGYQTVVDGTRSIGPLLRVSASSHVDFGLLLAP